MPPEKRRSERTDVSMEVIVTAKGFGPMTLQTGNMSECSVYLKSGGHILPEVGAEIFVTLSEFLGSTEPVAMSARVIHKNDLGMGIEFMGTAE